MKSLSLGLALPRIAVGDIDANTDQLLCLMGQAASQGVQLLCCGQLCLTGTSLGSMLDHPLLVEASAGALAGLAQRTAQTDITMIVSLPAIIDGTVRVANAIVSGGSVRAIGDGLLVWRTDSGHTLAVSSAPLECWSAHADESVARGAQTILFNHTAPWLVGSQAAHQARLVDLSAQHHVTMGLVSAGLGESVSGYVRSHQACIAHDGRVLAGTDDIDCQLLTVTGDAVWQTRPALLQSPHPHNPLPWVPTNEAHLAQILDIVARGIYERMRAILAQHIIIGLSGGLDSTMLLVSCLHMCAQYKLDPQTVIAVTMPSQISSRRTKSNARKLIDLLGVTGLDIPIGRAVNAHLRDIGHTDTDVTTQNAQARERTQILLDLGNKHNALVLCSSDMSEMALGFSTFGGDQLGHFAPNSGLPKTLIRALIKRESQALGAEELGGVLADILATPISPELAPNQSTEQILGPYDIHDYLLYHMIWHQRWPSEVMQMALGAFADCDPDQIRQCMLVLTQRLFAQHFKRQFGCDGIRVMPWSLDLLVDIGAISPRLWHDAVAKTI